MRRADAEKPVRTSRHALSGLAAALVALICSLLLFVTAGTTRSWNCGLCHAEVTNGGALSHSQMDCASCHRSPGIVGVITLRVQVVEMMAARAALGGAMVTQAIPDGRCLSCHQDVLKGTVVARGLRMSHSEPHEAGTLCVQCHALGLHAKLEGGAAGRVDMTECLRCHVVSPRSGDCKLCHIEDVTKERRLASGGFSATHGPNWQRLHGMGDLNTCSACHTASACQDCHATALPHEDQWLNLHGAASQVASSKCFACHSREFCDDCHGVEIPHPGGFRATHSKIAHSASDPRCVNCHDQSSCLACHVRHTHPGLPSEKADRLRREAGIDGR